ncbi:hypothetical protein [Streptomyces lydicus]|uniref:hypothetical protein n=1 Tax=Streptomyces lydicus TaxID=47763 RepID=UPI0010103E7A|nr:hypothetical protein [Streptomyces lydicus]MCZ1008027.1 hypothetical protein [Streptomyces lydicus]
MSMTVHPGPRAFDILARSHHSISHYTRHYGGHYGSSTSGVSLGSWWMIPLGVVLGVAWVFIKRRFRSG